MQPVGESEPKSWWYPSTPVLEKLESLPAAMSPAHTTARARGCEEGPQRTHPVALHLSIHLAFKGHMVHTHMPLLGARPQRSGNLEGAKSPSSLQYCRARLCTQGGKMGWSVDIGCSEGRQLCAKPLLQKCLAHWAPEAVVLGGGQGQQCQGPRGPGSQDTHLSRAPLVGMLRAKPRTPVCWKYGMLKMLAAMTATESEGFTKKPCLPRIMLRSWQGTRRGSLVTAQPLPRGSALPAHTAFNLGFVPNGSAWYRGPSCSTRA